VALPVVGLPAIARWLPGRGTWGRSPSGAWAWCGGDAACTTRREQPGGRPPPGAWARCGGDAACTTRREQPGGRSRRV